MRQDTPKMLPVLTVAGVLLPAIGVGAAFIVGGRTPGLAAVALFVLLILSGAVLGAISTVLALVRGEPWRGLQALVLVVNVGVAVFVGAPFPVEPLVHGILICRGVIWVISLNPDLVR